MNLQEQRVFAVLLHFFPHKMYFRMLPPPSQAIYMSSTGAPLPLQQRKPPVQFLLLCCPLDSLHALCCYC